jgi:transcriptional regulator with XRE-family HTH domain
MSEADKRDFGRRLRQLLRQKGMNQSDLARAVWGKTTTASGYEVAKNRDRISVYISGRAWPRPDVMKKIADTLGVTIAEIAPTCGFADKEPEWSVTKADGQDLVLVRINQMMSKERAAQIVTLIGAAR